MVGLGRRGSVFVHACVLSTCGMPTAGPQHLGAHSGGLASRPLSTGGQRAPAVGRLTTGCVPSLHPVSSLEATPDDGDGRLRAGGCGDVSLLGACFGEERGLTRKVV